MYFKLGVSVEPKEIGVANGIMQVQLQSGMYLDPAEPKRLEDYFFTTARKDDWHFPDFNLVFRGAFLPKAKETDFVVFSPFLFACPFLIHTRVADVLSNFNLPAHKYYPAFISKKNGDVLDQYRLFHVPLLGYDVVNFAESVFYQGNKLIGKKYFKFHSLEEYQLEKKFYKAERLVLNKKFDKRLDLFYDRFGGVQITERLMTALMQHQFSAMKILPASDPEFVV